MNVSLYKNTPNKKCPDARYWIFPEMYGDLKAQRRDRHRNKLYQCEKFISKINQKVFTNIEDVRSLCVKILCSDLIHQYFSGTNLLLTELNVKKMRPNKNRRTLAYSCKNELVFSGDTYPLWVVLHELSHSIARYHYAFTYPVIAENTTITKNPAGHGPLFCHIYAVLINMHFENNESEIFLSNLIENNIPHTPNHLYFQ